MKKRLFIAIEIPDKIKQKIAELQAELKEKVQAKWVRPENIHLTLIFLGDVLEEKIEEIKKCLAVIEFPQFLFISKGIGGFPQESQAYNIWFGLEDSDKLEKLQGLIVQKLEKQGFLIKERKFTPHLTIARLKQKTDLRAIIKNYQEKIWGEVLVQEVFLFQSELFPEGPKHKLCFKTELKPAKS